MKYWEIIAGNLSKAGWSWGCVSTVDSIPYFKLSSISGNDLLNCKVTGTPELSLIAARPGTLRNLSPNTALRATNAVAQLLNNLHVPFQSSRRILAFPCDTAFRHDYWIQRPEHRILMREFSDLLRNESNAQP